MRRSGMVRLLIVAATAALVWFGTDYFLDAPILTRALENEYVEPAWAVWAAVGFLGLAMAAIAIAILAWVVGGFRNQT